MSGRQGICPIWIHPWPDPATGDVRVSGYALIRAGCLTEDGKVNVTLTEDERPAGHLSDLDRPLARSCDRGRTGERLRANPRGMSDRGRQGQRNPDRG